MAIPSIVAADIGYYKSLVERDTSDTVLQFPIGERAAAVGLGRVATLRWDFEPTVRTTLRVVDAATGIESQSATIEGLVTGVALRENDVLFSVQGPGLDGGVWSLPLGETRPLSMVRAGELPQDSDPTVGGRYLMWASASGRTIAADLLRAVDTMSLDVFVGQEPPRRVDLPDRANVIGLTDEVALVTNHDFIGAASLESGTLLWNRSISALASFYLTPDGAAVVAAIAPADSPAPRPLELMRIDLLSGEADLIREWTPADAYPTLWPELSTDEVAVLGDESDLADALLLGDWSATGTAISLADRSREETVSVTMSPVLVP